VQHSESDSVAATSEGKLEVKSDGCRCVEVALCERQLAPILALAQFDEETGSWGNSCLAVLWREILKDAKPLAHVTTSGQVSDKNPEHLVKIRHDNPTPAKGVSLRQIGLSAALGIHFDNLKNAAPLKDVRASKVNSLLTPRLDREKFLTSLKQNSPYVAADIWRE
jgi:hypothetical protein